MLTAPHDDPLSARAIAAFVAAVDAGSVHGAADALGLTQSAVTKRIQALERRTGVTLLERGRLGAQPTELGRVLYPEAKAALAALDRAAQAVTRATQVHAHTLTIAASHTIGEFLVPRWLTAFRAVIDRPLQAEVDIANSPHVLRIVRRGEAQLGFVEGLDELRGLDRLTVMCDELVVVVAAGHPWARRESVRPPELQREAYLTREFDSGTRAVVTAALAGAGVELVPALVTPSIHALKRAALDGGFTLLSRLAVAAEVADGTLHTLTVRGVALERTLHAVRSGPAPRGSLSSRFWSWLARHARAAG